MKKKLTKEERKQKRAEYKQTDLYKYRKNRGAQYTFSGLSRLSLILPEGILLGVNWNDWITTQTDGIKVASGVILTVLTSLFIAYKKLNNDLKITFLNIVVGAWLATGVIYLISALLSELLMIFVCAAIGLTSSFLLDIPSQYFKEKKKTYGQDIKAFQRYSDISNAVFKAAGISKKERKEPTE